MQTTPIKVMLVDDHEIMRDGVREVLERFGAFEVVGDAGDGDAAVRTALSLKPEVIIMDVIMPIKNGIEACREITGMLPETRVLILTASSEEDAVMEAIAAGATGFLHKYYGKEQLLHSIKDILREDYRMPGDAIKRAFTGVRISTRNPSVEVEKRLTNREREILTLFSQGMTYARIAEIRGNSWLTIRNTIYGIQDKLRVQTKQALVVWAVRNGLLDNWDVTG